MKCWPKTCWACVGFRSLISLLAGTCVVSLSLSLGVVLQAQCSSLREHVATLEKEKGQLKNALAMALEHSAGLEAALGAAHRDAEAQRSQASQACPCVHAWGQCIPARACTLHGVRRPPCTKLCMQGDVWILAAV